VQDTSSTPPNLANFIHHFLIYHSTLSSTNLATKASIKHNKNSKEKSISWDRDGVNGGGLSITIILDWLGTGTNYLQWRGDLKSGTTKTRLCSEILQIMKDSRITHRDSKGELFFFLLFFSLSVWINSSNQINFFLGVQQKIGDLQALYNTTCNWKKNTGQGILEQDELNGMRTVEGQFFFVLLVQTFFLFFLIPSFLEIEKLLEICRYWEELDPIMGSGLVTEPLHI
jgi:hypothetical protein